MSKLIGWLLIFAVCAVICTAAGGWLVSGYTMTSAAMSDAVKEGSIVFINRLAIRAWDPGRGDVILFQVPGEEAQLLRRIVALPGETLEVKNGEVFINGAKVGEPWLVSETKEGAPQENAVPTFFGPVVIPPETYFVLGDNRFSSPDSRTFGVVKRELMIGKALSLFRVVAL